MPIMAQLAHRFEQNNADCCGEIQTPRSLHRNREQVFGVRREQTFRQPFGFAAEDQKIAGAKGHLVIGPPGFGRKEKEAPRSFARLAQLLERIPELHVDFLPVIETRPFQLAIVDGKSEGLDQVQRRTGGEAKPPDVARVRRNLRLDQDNVEGGGVRECWSNGVLD